MSASFAVPELRLPWESTAGEDRRFLRVLAAVVLPLMVLALVVPALDLPPVTVESIKRDRHIDGWRLPQETT